MKSFLRGSNGGGVVGWFRKPWENSNIDLLNSHKKIIFKKKKRIKKGLSPATKLSIGPPPPACFFFYIHVCKKGDEFAKFFAMHFEVKYILVS